MTRLRHQASGAVVTVSDEKAQRLGSEWQPVDAAKPDPEVAPEVKKVAMRRPARK